MKLKWKREPGSRIQAPISHGGRAHHYVISHRPEEHTVSYRPPGEHHHVGSYRTERDAKAAADQHAQTGTAPPSNTRSSIAAWGPGGPPPEWGSGRTSAKKTPAQIKREIAEILAKKSGGHSAHSTKTKRPPTWKQIAADYKRRAAAARKAGGQVKIYPDGSILVHPTKDSDEYFYQDWQADEFRDEITRENRELLDHISFEDLVLAQSQNW